MEISLEDLYVGLKGSKDTIYNFSRQSKMLLSYTWCRSLRGSWLYKNKTAQPVFS